MKFLHTADWHVGRTIRNRSRLDEHQAVFAEIVAIAKQEHVDAVLVTGDIFHERRPPLEAEELVAETLAELARAQIPSVVIPGNHDDPARLRTLKPLGDLVHVHIVSDFSADLASLTVPIAGRDGKETALIGCLPYLHPHQVLSAAEGAGTSEDARLSMYQSKVQDYFRALEEGMERIDRHAVSIVLAHVYIADCEFGGGEWRSSVFPINSGVLPAHVHYVALGHLHKPQHIPGAKAQARYAGSILQMDFGEREQQKSVCLIEAHPGKPAAVSQVTLSKGKWLLRRSGTAEAILAQAQDFTDAWVEVVLQNEMMNDERGTRNSALSVQRLDLVDRVRALPGVIALRFDDSQTITRGEGDPATHRIPEAQSRHRDGRPGERPATELFSDYYKTKRKADPDQELLALFDRLYQEVSTAADEPQ